jgi:hypothetical protein
MTAIDPVGLEIAKEVIEERIEELKRKEAEKK